VREISQKEIYEETDTDGQRIERWKGKTHRKAEADILLMVEKERQ
jgi:hypothetical protein